MEKLGVVSIWFGKMKSPEFVKKYVDLIYDEDGECVPSEFLKDFNIDMDDLDEDFIEKATYDFCSDQVEQLLKGCSYSEDVIPKVCNLVGETLDDKVNAVILIYNFQ